MKASRHRVLTRARRYLRATIFSLDKFQEGKFDVTFYANILLPFLQTQFVVTTHLLENPTTYAGYRGKIARANLTTYHLSTSDLKFIRHFLTKYQRKDDFPLEEALNSDSIYNSLKFLRLKGIVHDDSIRLKNADDATNLIQFLSGVVKV